MDNNYLKDDTVDAHPLEKLSNAGLEQATLVIS